MTIMNRRSGRGCLLCSRKRSTGQKVKNNLEKNGSLYDWALKHGELGQKIIREFDTEENEKSGIKIIRHKTVEQMAGAWYYHSIVSVHRRRSL